MSCSNESSSTAGAVSGILDRIYCVLNMSSDYNSTIVDVRPEDSFWDLPPEGSVYYSIEGFLSLFYLVHPKRTMYERLDDTPNFYAMGVRHFPLLILFEYLLLLVRRQPIYRWNDSLVGICTFIISAIPQLLIEVTMFNASNWIHNNWRLVSLPHDSMWTWILCLLAVDLTLYIAHRLLHEVLILWAFHQIHHSSEFYNQFSVARNSFVDKFVVTVCMMPLSLILPTAQLKAHYQLNLVYQFWVHTRTVGHLGILEHVFVTPTQHSVHHGRNRFCIDVNYGAVLSIWDQLFHTMEWPVKHQNEQIYYGLVYPVRSWDVVHLLSHYHRGVYERVKQMTSVSDKLSTILFSPRWKPGYPRMGYLEDVPLDVIEKKPYDKESPFHIYMYCAVSLFAAWFVNINLVKNFLLIPWWRFATAATYNLWSLCNVCYILEHKSFAARCEIIHSLTFFIVDWLILTDIPTPYLHVLTVMKLWFAFCIVFWTYCCNSWSQLVVSENRSNSVASATDRLETVPSVNRQTANL